MQSRRYTVRGKVQGVWYRATLQKHAAASGFFGYVKNMPDGSVEAAVSCEDKVCFERFERLLKQGSPLSRVESLSYETLDTIFTDGFEVRY